MMGMLPIRVRKRLMPITSSTLDRQSLLDWYARNRDRSHSLFDLLSEDAYYARPISLRHPIVFYEGHLPAFSFNTLVKRGLGEPGIDARLEALFARGIDPHESQAASGAGPDRGGWPSRAEVQQFAAEADRRVVAALRDGDIERPGHPLLDRAEAAHAILEHEAMHQETLLYMWHRLPFSDKRRPQGYEPVTAGAVPAREWVDVPAGRATLGIDAGVQPFAWDNERPACAAHVDAFAIERHDVTNTAFLEFVEAGGYADAQWWRPEDWAWIQREGLTHPSFWERHGERWYWRGMFDRLPLPPAWPVYLSFAEASAYARWRGERLPTEAEYQRAAYGTRGGGERPHPWGEAAPSPAHGVFDFASWDPQPAGSHPAGRSDWGVDDLMGNGWTWTASSFEPFPGFVATPSYPEYSADFFDGEHVVLKGASPATARELMRPTFRNWFRPRYPYVYATFRCVRAAGK
jgi:ergothioneine biosynthesis protein EgtB